MSLRCWCSCQAQTAARSPRACKSSANVNDQRPHFRARIPALGSSLVFRVQRTLTKRRRCFGHKRVQGEAAASGKFFKVLTALVGVSARGRGEATGALEYGGPGIHAARRAPVVSISVDSVHLRPRDVFAPGPGIATTAVCNQDVQRRVAVRCIFAWSEATTASCPRFPSGTGSCFCLSTAALARPPHPRRPRDPPAQVLVQPPLLPQREAQGASLKKGQTKALVGRRFKHGQCVGGQLRQL
jgi:hypothetical protein